MDSKEYRLVYADFTGRSPLMSCIQYPKWPIRRSSRSDNGWGLPCFRYVTTAVQASIYGTVRVMSSLILVAIAGIVEVLWKCAVDCGSRLGLGGLNVCQKGNAKPFSYSTLSLPSYMYFFFVVLHPHTQITLQRYKDLKITSNANEVPRFGDLTKVSTEKLQELETLLTANLASFIAKTIYSQIINETPLRTPFSD